MWKIPDGVSKLDSGHLADSVTKIIKDINTEHASKVAAARLAEGCGPPPRMGKGSADPLHTGRMEGTGGAELIDPASWDSTEKTRWLYTYFLGKLSTDLHIKAISIEGKNGLEMYRQICNIIDAVPEN